MKQYLFIALLATAACETRDETVSAFVNTAGSFNLHSIDGVPYASIATIDISTPGMISGNTPCNSYSAAQVEPYPWFRIGPISETLNVCPQIGDERRLFTGLREMTLAEVSGDTLILSNTQGGEMVFQAP